MTDPSEPVAVGFEARRAARHDRQIGRYQRLAARLRRRISVLAAVRLVAFLGMGLFAGAAYIDRLYALYGGLAGLCAAFFAVAVALHRGPYERLPRIRALARVHGLAAARLRGDFAALPHDAAAHLDPARPHLAELQILGRGSLFQLLDRAALPPGRARLAARLTDPPPADRVPALQEAARELARKPLFRHRLQAEGLLAGERFDAARLERLMAWAETSEADADAVFARRAGRAALVLAATAWICILAAGLAGLPAPWKAALGLNLLFFLGTTGRLSRTYAELLDRDEARPFVGLRRMYERVARARFQAPEAARLQAALTSAKTSPAARLAGLQGLTESLAVRFNPLAAFVANALTCWEALHVGRLLRWRALHGPHIRQDLDVLAELEVLCGVAGFAADHPDYAWPTLAADARPALSARALGHPLFPAARRRANDFDLAPAGGGQMALVTGSNMAGKSSFLRTVGVNVVLAQAGAPVCAAALTLRPCALATSIQVVDAPEQGLSRFYAEVKRIRRILDACAAAETEPELPRLYLIDEMLSGTNSRERNVASLSVARRLLSYGRSFGLVTTHDLALAALGERFPGQVDTCHFTDRFDGTALHFDYRLRPGVATTTNALDVLRLEGIEIAGSEIAGSKNPD